MPLPDNSSIIFTSIISNKTIRQVLLISYPRVSLFSRWFLRRDQRRSRVTLHFVATTLFGDAGAIMTTREYLVGIREKSHSRGSVDDVDINPPVILTRRSRSNALVKDRHPCRRSIREHGHYHPRTNPRCRLAVSGKTHGGGIESNVAAGDTIRCFCQTIIISFHHLAARRRVSARRCPRG